MCGSKGGREEADFLQLNESTCFSFLLSFTHSRNEIVIMIYFKGRDDYLISTVSGAN